jgi:hypothetical protein
VPSGMFDAAVVLSPWFDLAAVRFSVNRWQRRNLSSPIANHPGHRAWTRQQNLRLPYWARVQKKDKFTLSVEAV